MTFALKGIAARLELQRTAVPALLQNDLVNIEKRRMPKEMAKKMDGY